MTFVAPTGPDVAFDIDDDDILFVAKNVMLRGNVLLADRIFVDIAGTMADQDTAVEVRGSSSTVLVEQTGEVRGFGTFGTILRGLNNSLTNYGLIDLKLGSNAIHAAVLVNNSVMTGGFGSTVDNYGLISSNVAAIRHQAASETLTINNYGEIKSATLAVESTGNVVDSIINDGKITGKIDLGDGADRVVNSGTITGDILLGAGADLYDGSEAGGSVNGTVSGGAGADELYGGSKSDVLDGGSEADYLDGGRGVDMLMGGSGDDIYIVDDKLDMVTELAGDANDQVRAKVSYTLAAGADIEWLTTTNASGTTAISLTGNEIAQTLLGNEGKNILSGAGGNDVLQGYGGNDTLNGGSGADTMYGGMGDDIYYVNSGSDIATEVGGGGTDLVKASASFTLFTDVENLTLTGTSKISGTGNSGANIITGNSAHNVLKGAGGADVFVFNTALVSANYDTISDYSSDDRFQIDNSVFVGLKTGALASSAFKVIASATSTVGVDGTDRILYDKTHGDLYFDQDGSGSTFSRIKFAHITENMTIDNTDFLVI